MRPRLIDPTAGLLIATFLAIVGGLAVLVVTGASATFDAAVTEAVRTSHLREPLGILGAITEAGSTWAVIVLAGVAIVVGAAIGPWRHGVLAAVVIGVASLANSAMKVAVGRARPDLLDAIITEPGFSFPSGHSALGMVGWGVLAVLVFRTRLPRMVRLGLVVAMAALVLLIGISRVYLGVHHPTDVIAGWAAGAVLVVLYERITRTVSREPAAEAVDVDPATPRSGRPAAG